MPITTTEKQKIIQQLLAAKTKSYRAEVILLLKREPEQASLVKTKGKELSRKIDHLIMQSISDWLGESEIIINDVQLTNQKIQRSINNIQNDVNIANNVVKIVGFIDDIIKIVSAIV